jgi:hypothetical protein
MRKLFVAIALVVIPVSVYAQDRAAVVSTLADVRKAYPARNLTPAQLAELLNAVALKNPGWGLLAKDSGNNCPLPNGVRISCDWLVHQASGLGCDALSDAEGAAGVTCGGLEPFDKSRFVAPVAGGSAPPPPPPPPPPASADAATVDLQRQQLEVLVQIVAKLQEQVDAQAKQTADTQAALVAAVKELKDQIAKGVKVKF